MQQKPTKDDRMATVQLGKEHFANLKGKRYLLFSGLLALAHDKGLRSIETELVQIPTEENGRVAIVKARATFEDGGYFDGIGDASPENVGRGIVPHTIRMAETRGVARALRCACNVAEALADDPSDAADDVPQGPRPSRGSVAEASRDTPLAGPQKLIRKTQYDLLVSLAEELRGENGVARLEGRIGKPLAELTEAEADEWIDRIQPHEEQQ